MDDNNDSPRTDLTTTEDPTAPTTENLAAQLTDLTAQLAKAKRSLVWEAVACSSIIATVLALLAMLLWTSWPGQGLAQRQPTTISTGY